MLGLTLAGMRQRRLRVLVGFLSLAVAFALVCLSMSVTHRMKSTLAGFDEHSLMVMALDGSELPFATTGQIRTALGPTTDVQWNAIFGGSDERTQVQYAVFATSDGYFAQYPATLLRVAPGLRERWLDDKQGVLVTEDLARRQGWKPGDTVTLKTSNGPMQVHVIGTTAGAVSLGVFMHYDYADATRADRGQLASVTIHGVADAGRAARTLDEALAGHVPGVVVQLERSVHERLMAVSGAVPRLLEWVAYVFVFSTLMTLLSNVVVSLRERRREFGTLRALGFTRGRVVALVIAEFTTLGLAAGFVGCGVPYLLFHEKGLRMGEMALENVTTEPLVCALVLLGGLVLNVLVVVLPSVALARTDTVVLLEDR